jgi:uncharacterized membrane protein YadS
MKAFPRSKSLVPIRLTCGIVGAYHVGEGVAGLIGGELAARTAALMFGVSVQRLLPVTDQFQVVFRFVGAFALAFGIMMLLAAADPRKCRAVILGGIVFFAARLITRLFEAALLQEAFDISTAVFVRGTVAIVLFLAALIVFFPRGPESAPSPGDTT